MEKKNKRTRRTFSEEFKQEAIELIDKIGLSKAEHELDIGESTLRAWRKKFRSPEAENSQAKKSYQELERENRKLAKEIGYLREINKVLKKSTAIFSNDQLVNLK